MKTVFTLAAFTIMGAEAARGVTADLRALEFPFVKNSATVLDYRLTGSSAPGTAPYRPTAVAESASTVAFYFSLLDPKTKTPFRNDEPTWKDDSERDAPSVADFHGTEYVDSDLLIAACDDGSFDIELSAALGGGAGTPVEDQTGVTPTLDNLETAGFDTIKSECVKYQGILMDMGLGKVSDEVKYKQYAREYLAQELTVGRAVFGYNNTAVRTFYADLDNVVAQQARMAGAGASAESKKDAAGIAFTKLGDRQRELVESMKSLHSSFDDLSSQVHNEPPPMPGDLGENPTALQLETEQIMIALESARSMIVGHLFDLDTASKTLDSRTQEYVGDYMKSIENARRTNLKATAATSGTNFLRYLLSNYVLTA